MRSVGAVVATVALGLTAVVGLGAAFDRAPARPVVIGVGRNVLVNRPGIIDADNSPSLARNPRDANNLVVAHRVDRPRFSAGLTTSRDGGRTWRPVELPLPADRSGPYAPDVAFGPDGRLYVAYLSLAGRQNVPDNLWLSTSDDGGRTLSPPTEVAGALAFQPRVAVSGDGAVVMTWLQAADVGLFRFTEESNPVVAARSTDRGATFAPPVTVSDASRSRVGAASPVFNATGDLFVLYEDFKSDRRDFENLEGPPWDEPFALVVTRSGDGGRSFSPGVELESGLVPTHRFLAFLPDYPSLAAGPGATLYVTWADGRNGNEDVFLRRSRDGGRAWSKAIQVNDNPRRNATAQYLPRVAVAPDGRVDVVFFDRRRDPRDVMNDTYLATSLDGVTPFRNARISSESSDSRVGPSAAQQFGVDFGARLGLVSDAHGAVAAWTDARLGSEDTGRQDVATTSVALARGGRGLRRLPLTVGVGAALAFVGATVALRRKRGMT